MTVVRELTERRTQYGTSYLLSNGLYRTVISHGPVHYKDPAGDWQAIDTLLVRGAGGRLYETAVSAVTVTAQAGRLRGRHVDARRARGRPERSSAATEDGASRSKAAAATYIGRRGRDRPRLRGTGDGLKETIVLASPAAPASFTYTPLPPRPYLAPRRGDGTWGLYAGMAEEPIFLLGASTPVTPRPTRPASPPGATRRS